MGFVTREWLPRLVEFAGRRKLTNVSTGEITYVDVERAEGNESQAGDAWAPSNSNDLEQRIADAFDEINQSSTPDYALGTVLTTSFGNTTIVNDGWITGWVSSPPAAGYYGVSLRINGFVVWLPQINSTSSYVSSIRFSFGLFKVKKNDIISITDAGGDSSHSVQVNFFSPR